MRKLFPWLFATLAAVLFIFAGPTNVSQAKEITQVTGTQASDAVIYDQDENIMSHDAALPESQEYTVRYTWSIPDSVWVLGGDTFKFYVPSNVKIPMDDSFQMTSTSTGKAIGSAYIAEGSHVGTVTLNWALAGPQFNKKGYINLAVTGATPEVEPPVTPMEVFMSKFGSFENATDTNHLNWEVNVYPGANALVNPVIKDTFSDNQSFIDGSATIQDLNGQTVPFTTSIDGNVVTFNITGTYSAGLQLHYSTLADTNTGQIEYSNTANLTDANGNTGTADASVDKYITDESTDEAGPGDLQAPQEDTGTTTDPGTGDTSTGTTTPDESGTGTEPEPVAPDEGGTSTGTTTPDEGGTSTGTTTPDEGGTSTGTTTPDEGGTSTGTTTPDESGTGTEPEPVAPDEGGTSTGTTTPDESGTGTEPEPVAPDEGGTSTGTTTPDESGTGTEPEPVAPDEDGTSTGTTEPGESETGTEPVAPDEGGTSIGTEEPNEGDTSTTTPPTNGDSGSATVPDEDGNETTSPSNPGTDGSTVAPEPENPGTGDLATPTEPETPTTTQPETSTTGQTPDISTESQADTPVVNDSQSAGSINVETQPSMTQPAATEPNSSATNQSGNTIGETLPLGNSTEFSSTPVTSSNKLPQTGQQKERALAQIGILLLVISLAGTQLIRRFKTKRVRN